MENPKRILSFHIGSGFISATVTNFSRVSEVVPSIIFSVSRSITPEPIFVFSDFKKSTFKALALVCDDIARMPIGSLDVVVCFLGSPWFASQARTIHIAKNTPFKVTDGFITETLKKDLDLFQKNELASYSQAGDQALVFEQELTKIMLNGYHVKNHAGLSTKELDLSYMVSITSHSFVKECTEVISRPLHTTDIVFRSVTHAHVSVARDLLISHDYFLAVDVSAELTDVTLVEDGVMTQTASFPYGNASVLRNLASSLGIDVHEAETLLSLYLEDRLETSRRIIVEKEIKVVLSDWSQAFEQTLSVLSKTYNVPHLVVLIGQKPIVQLFKLGIESELLHQFVYTEQPFSVVIMETSLLKSFFKSEMPVHHESQIVEALLLAKKNNIFI